MLDIVQEVQLVYDVETGNVTDEYLRTGDSRDGIVVMYLYNAPSGTSFIEAFTTDLSLGVPGDEKKALINTRIHLSSSVTKNNYYFNVKRKTGGVGLPTRFIDYLHDPADYMKVIVQYADSGYQSGTFYYE